MKFLYLSDTHITAKTPSSRLDDIQETIKLKFKELGVLIAKEGITAVIHGGDMFHRPEVSNKFVGEMAEIIRNYNVPFYVVPGNHDVQGQNEESLPHSKLGLLMSAGVIKILNRANPITFTDSNYTISFEGQEYHPNIDKEPDIDYRIENQTADFKVLVAHSMMLEKPFHEGVLHTLTKDIKTKADLVLGAHYHPGFKAHEHNNTLFISPGSLLRMEASTYSINNKPRVLILEYTNGVFSHTEYELKTAKEGKEVFSSANLERKIYSNTLENFNSKLRSIKLDDVNIVSLIDNYAKAHQEDIDVVNKAKDEIIKIQREEVVDNGFVPSKGSVHINKVEIKNFQAHEKRVVDFVNGLNTIVGESNAGKTAILRAIYWVLYDKPSGSAFITTGKKSCSVKLHLSNGYIIERKRSRSSSGSYILTKPDGTETEYKGFANNVPIDIINAHQMPEINIAGKKYRLNISSQLEGAFMVTSSSNERMAMIGALVDADRADAAKKVVLSEKRNLSASHKKISELRDVELEKIKSFSHLDNMKVSIEMLEMADSKLDSDELLLNEYKDIKDVYSKALSNSLFLDNALSNVKIIEKSDIDNFNTTLDVLENISNLSVSYKENVLKLSKVSDELSFLGNGVSKEEINDYTNLLNELDTLMTLKDSYCNYKSSLDSISNSMAKYETIIDKSEIMDYSTMVDNLDILRKCKIEYENKSSMNFDFAYDIEALGSLREEYVSLMRGLTELTSYITKIDEMNDKLDAINQKELECLNEIDNLEKIKLDRLEELKGQTQICESCGSEVTVDKLIHN